MKIFSTETFEKLKIRPVNVTDITLNESFCKSDLRTFDIVTFVKERHTYYMVFCDNDFAKYSTYFSNKPDAKYGVFFFFDINDSFGPCCFMPMLLYEDDLLYESPFNGNTDFSVSGVYIHPNTYTGFPDNNIESLSQDYLEQIISQYNFKHIKLR